MKKIIITGLILLLITTTANAVIITGTGATKEEAINDGLREAVEMFTSTFVYGVTDVANYEIHKDQIVAASTGYVKSYRIIKSSKIDNSILITLDVKLSEDKIENILRENVKLMTVEDVLKDYNNVTQRQDQIKKLTEMFNTMVSRPIREKYSVIYEGYEIKRIGAKQVDVILNVRVAENPFYHRIYNEILRNLSEAKNSTEVWLLGGNYKIETGKIIGAKYYISQDSDAQIMNEIHIQIYVGNEPVDKCREYRDNLLVVFSTTEFIAGFLQVFPKAFKQALNDEEIVIDDKWDNVTIKKSRVLPPEGLPLKIQYRISDSKDIKTLANLKLTMQKCR